MRLIFLDGFCFFQIPFISFVKIQYLAPLHVAPWHNSVSRKAKFFHQTCADVDCLLEDLPNSMTSREWWRERESNESVLSARFVNVDRVLMVKINYYPKRLVPIFAWYSSILKYQRFLQIQQKFSRILQSESVNLFIFAISHMSVLSQYSCSVRHDW